MRKLLVINSSILGSNSESKKLAELFLEQWKSKVIKEEKESKDESNSIIFRDIETSGLPVLSNTNVAGLSRSGATELEPEALLVRQASDKLIKELDDVNYIVLASPMYNFGISAGLKNYFDLVIRAGKAFEYTDKGPVGLLADKPVLIITTGGGEFQETKDDSQRSHLTTLFKFIGFKSLTFIRAHGLQASVSKKEESLNSAKQQIVAYVQSEADKILKSQDTVGSGTVKDLIALSLTTSSTTTSDKTPRNEKAEESVTAVFTS